MSYIYIFKYYPNLLFMGTINLTLFIRGLFVHLRTNENEIIFIIDFRYNLIL